MAVGFLHSAEKPERFTSDVSDKLWVILSHTKTTTTTTATKLKDVKDAKKKQQQHSGLFLRDIFSDDLRTVTDSPVRSPINLQPFITYVKFQTVTLRAQYPRGSWNIPFYVQCSRTNV